MEKNVCLKSTANNLLLKPYKLADGVNECKGKESKNISNKILIFVMSKTVSTKKDIILYNNPIVGCIVKT